MSQRALAEKLNKQKDVIQRIESGKTKKIDTLLLQGIALHLDCNVDYLLLKSEDAKNPHAKLTYLDLPEYQHQAEGLIYSNSQLRMDIIYMLDYMHPHFQKQLFDTIHTFITFHKTGVHFPNTKPAIAKKITPSELEKEIEKNFFDKERKLHS